MPTPTKRKSKEPKGAYYPCYCTDYNGGQCYNCLNGAHHICGATKGCATKTTSVGVILSIIPAPKNTIKKGAKKP